MVILETTTGYRNDEPTPGLKQRADGGESRETLVTGTMNPHRD